MANSRSETRDKRARRMFGCDGKRRYNSWNEAERIAKSARRRHDSGAVLAPYRCKMCGGFHLTTVDELERDRIKSDERKRKGGYS